MATKECQKQSQAAKCTITGNREKTSECTEWLLGYGMYVHAILLLQGYRYKCMFMASNANAISEAQDTVQVSSR